MELELTPRLRFAANANSIRFDSTYTIRTALLTNQVGRDFGIDLSAGLQWRPLLKDHVIVSGGYQDVYSKSHATLTNARSARMAEALQISNPVQSPRCTACHAPLSAVAIPTNGTPGLIGNFATESVSCVSCHGPSDAWIRTHTRPDYTHAERVAAGMKDLHSPYARANTCLACHQNIDPELVSRARHPELIFELDGQAASQPKHWKESAGWSGAQYWYVGQLVALREVSWGLAQKPFPRNVRFRTTAPSPG